MLEEVVKDYSAYFKLDVSSGFQTVQDVIDNMLTRLEELTSVLQMIKLKNGDCVIAVTEDISKYRSEITTLSKKVTTINEVITKLQSNVDIIEKQVERAEIDFGVNNDNKIKSLLKPFLMRSKTPDNIQPIIPPDKIKFQSVLHNFEDNQ
uniref:Biogenesis of lysosome-related organelles complex 1 subunit 4 n=1 Tax=Pectinophora gossypiella TaxID=13191 RepID=A0A1E1WM05_PECGO